MTRTKIHPGHWNVILPRINEGRCVPFLGAGVNIKRDDDRTLKGHRMPLGGELALLLFANLLEPDKTEFLNNLTETIKRQKLGDYRERIDSALKTLATSIPRQHRHRRSQNPSPGEVPIAQSSTEHYRKILMDILPDDLKKDDKLAHVITHPSLEGYGDLTRIGLQDLARVALRVEAEIGAPDFMEILKSLLPENSCQPSPLLRTVATLPFRLIVTTNYDQLMERSLELFNLQDLIDTRGLVAKLKDTTNPLSESLRGKFSSTMQQLLIEYDDPGTLLTKLRDEPNPLSQYLQDLFPSLMTQLRESEDDLDHLSALFSSALIEELNQLLQGPNLFDPHLFARVPLSAKTQDLLEKKPKQLELVRFHRWLLAEAYPRELERESRAYKLVVQSIKGYKGKRRKALEDKLSADEHLTIYKLHGTLNDESSDYEKRPLITEEDYIEFLTFVGGNPEGLHPLVKENIVHSTLLFLGYGLEDWNFRAIFKGLIENLPPHKQRKSFAIQRDPTEFWVNFWGRKNVVIYNVDLNDFAEELEEKYKAKYG